MLLNRSHKKISFDFKTFNTDPLDGDKLSSCKNFDGKMEVITHPVFDHRIRYIFHSKINRNLQPVK